MTMTSTHAGTQKPRTAILGQLPPIRRPDGSPIQVLLIDDERALTNLVTMALKYEGWNVDVAHDGREALTKFASTDPDILVLDIMLPDVDGLRILQRIRAAGTYTPVLFLTARDSVTDRVTGLTAGADDYLTKPFELRELVLRLRALDRRRAHNRPPVREIAGLRLDPFRREVYRDGRYVALTRKQFAVLEVLVAAEGGVVSAEELLEQAWDEHADPFTNAVRITVSGLRKRLGEPWVIATVAGVGYRIDTPPGAVSEGSGRG